MGELNQPGPSGGHRASLSWMLELKYFAFTFCEQTAAGNEVTVFRLI